MTKAILVTGATGKQGGSVIDALIASPQTSDFLILAVTRNGDSPSAQKLASRAKNIKVVTGNLDDVPSLFAAAKETAGQSIWGVYSVQVSMGPGVTYESEVKQGKSLIDESVKAGVTQFVYSSVERGGDEHSWNNPTPVEHFKSKYEIEHHLRDSAGSMSWTILRPVAFMDNLEPGMKSRVFLTAMRDSLNGRPNQWVATTDIGAFATKAFESPSDWRNKAIGLAGDSLTFDEQQALFEKKTSAVPTPVFAFMGSFLKYMVTDLGLMLNWFGDEGYKADIQGCKKISPALMDFETWLEKKSPFPMK